jgi:hypothetical protein
MAEPLASLAECYRTIAQQAMRARLHELARTTAADPSVDAYRRSLADVCAMLDQAVAVCAIELVERPVMIDAWIRTEARFWLCRLRADSGDRGRGFRLIADSDSDRSRTAFR